MHGGETIRDPKIVANLFAVHLAGVSRKDPSAPGGRYQQDLEAVDFFSFGCESYNVLFSLSELKTALSRCHDLSPGSDDIPYAFLSHMSDSAVASVLAQYNLIW